MSLVEADRSFLAVAIDEARRGWDEGGIPIGAALVVDGKLVASGHNRRVQSNSAIRHGETDCLENAGRLPASTYARATMYTTLSPCAMCSGAMLLYGIPRVVVGENQTFMGEEDLLRSRGVEVVLADVGSVESGECLRMMERMIREKPQLWNEDIGVPSE